MGIILGNSKVISYFGIILPLSLWPPWQHQSGELFIEGESPKTKASKMCFPGLYHTTRVTCHPATTLAVKLLLGWVWDTLLASHIFHPCL